jgi:hypothetical protein
MLFLYMVCEYNSNVLTAMCIKFETFTFLLTLSGVSCLLAQEMFTNTHSMSWPWDTRPSYRSIISELLSLSFHTATQNSQRKKIKLFMVTSRINLFRKEDLGELVKIIEDLCNPFLLFLPRNLTCGDPRDLSYTEMLCVLVTLATSDTGVTSPRPEHHRQAGRN